MGPEMCGHTLGYIASTDPASSGPHPVKGKCHAPFTHGEAEARRRGLLRATGLPSCFTQDSVALGLSLAQRLPKPGQGPICWPHTA